MNNTCSNCRSVKESITKARIILKNNFSFMDKKKLIKSKVSKGKSTIHSKKVFVIVETADMKEILMI